MPEQPEPIGKGCLFICCMFFVVMIAIGVLGYRKILRDRESTFYDPPPMSYSSGEEIDKIITAKKEVLAVLNYPNTADFHDMSTKVNGNVVTLTVTAKNAFGVPETRTFRVTVK